MADLSISVDLDFGEAERSLRQFERRLGTGGGGTGGGGTGGTGGTGGGGGLGVAGVALGAAAFAGGGRSKRTGRASPVQAASSGLFEDTTLPPPPSRLRQGLESVFAGLGRTRVAALAPAVVGAGLQGARTNRQFNRFVRGALGEFIGGALVGNIDLRETAPAITTATLFDPFLGGEDPGTRGLSPDSGFGETRVKAAFAASTPSFQDATRNPQVVLDTIRAEEINGVISSSGGSVPRSEAMREAIFQQLGSGAGRTHRGINRAEQSLRNRIEDRVLFGGADDVLARAAHQALGRRSNIEKELRFAFQRFGGGF